MFIISAQYYKCFNQQSAQNNLPPKLQKTCEILDIISSIVLSALWMYLYMNNNTGLLSKVILFTAGIETFVTLMNSALHSIAGVYYIRQRWLNDYL